ncbi:MAG: glycosyltransferase [Bacteroidota bacterium]|nr:glycosyltransferase [Bacteroidota bacterium]
MSNCFPKISVILPAFNVELYIKDAIESILNQTLSDFELLIYNDGSTDNTHHIISSFNDDRIIYKRIEKNAGYLNLLNGGLALAKGKYIARMDADDIAFPNRFEEQFNYLENNPEVGICGSWVEVIGNLTGIVERPVTFEQIQSALFFGCPLTHPTIMMRTDLIRKYNLKYRQEYYYAEDHYFFAEASFHFKIVNLPLVLLKYRIHDQQIGSAKWKEQFIVKSNIQAKLFYNALDSATVNDFIWLKIFFEEMSIPDENWIKNVAYYNEKIVRDNQKLQVYPQQILAEAVTELFRSKTQQNFYKYFFIKYYNRRNYSPLLIYQFIKEKYKPQQYLGWKLTLFFIVKCLVGYRKKTIIRL